MIQQKDLSVRALKRVQFSEALDSRAENYYDEILIKSFKRSGNYICGLKHFLCLR